MRNKNGKYLISYGVVSLFAIIFLASIVWFFVSYRENAGILPPAGVSSQTVNTTGTGQNQIARKIADNLAIDNLVKVSLTAVRQSSPQAGNENYEISVPKGARVYDAMKVLASSTSFTYSSRYYSGLGYFIEAINEIKNANGNYWTLYVNGKYATVGASEYVLSAGDRIEWRYIDKTN